MLSSIHLTLLTHLTHLRARLLVHISILRKAT